MLLQLYCVLGLLVAGDVAQAANWAQVTGEKQQNAALPARNPWPGRWGVDVAVVQNPTVSDEVVLDPTQRSTMYLIGGDDMKIDDGGGQYHNDVWISNGALFEVSISEVSRTRYNDRLSSIVSRSQWANIAPDASPPDGMDYREWLCCIANWECRSLVCEPIDPYLGARRFSPRRNHATQALGTDLILVLGGKARSMEDIPELESIGGVLGPRIRFREKEMLMSDVWASSDGVSWDIANVGCYEIHQEDLTVWPYDVTAPEYRGGKSGRTNDAGSRVSTCSSDADCVAARLGDAKCIRGACVCQHWSPRERHAAAEFDDALYVVGGQTTVSRHLCAKLACGENYRVWLNDIWRSDDRGRTWVQVVKNAPWTPRADHGLAVGGGYMWIAGGRTADVDVYSSDTLLNDVWVTRNGVDWSVNGSVVGWEPRCTHELQYLKGKLYVIGGQVKVPPLPPPRPLTPVELVEKAAGETPLKIIKEDIVEDEVVVLDGERVSSLQLRLVNEVWAWNPFDVNDTWTLDFSNDTIHYSYVWPNTTLRHPYFNYSENMLTVLDSMGVGTVHQFATMPKASVQRLQDPDLYGMDDICTHKQLAKLMVEQCGNKYLPYDGEWYKRVNRIEGSAASGGPLLIPDPEADDGCLETPNIWSDEYLDVVCRQSIQPRALMASAVMDGLMYVIGGYEGPDQYSSDTWYRDEKPPRARFVQTPGDGGPETVFDFVCDEPVCLFEYRVLNSGGMVIRDWSLVRPPIDFREWLDSGVYTFELRSYDPAGNRDVEIVPGINSHTWEYVPPLPWLLIILCILAFLILCVVLFILYRRRKKRKALERYALKRMRRKMKAAKEGDWRAAYDDGRGGRSKFKKARKRRKGKGKGGAKGKGKGKGKSKGKGKGKKTKKK